VPWELGRMQHLVWLAWAYVLAKQGLQNISGPDLYRAQFRNQVLDFIAQNPPRFGVQWACTMDVAIRVSNWLVAYDLFRAYGATFDGPFARVFARSVYEHGLHIVRNLEWAVRLRHNHYLANIVGLLFVAAYLPATTETDTWLAFAIEELIHEVRAQFHPEGSNFEGSVCYHRLSAEMVVYATALVLGLPAKRLRAVRAVSLDTALRQMGLEAFLIRLCRLSDRAEDRLPKSASPASGASVFPSWYFERLERMAEFTMHVTKPNGHVAQIGDNDSGRFLKVMPAGRRLSAREAKAAHSNLNDRYGMSEDDPYWMEDHLDHAHLVGAVSGPFDRKEFIEFGGANSLDRALVQSLAGGRRIESYLSRGERTVADGTTIGSVATSRQLTEHLRKSKGYARQAIEFVPPRGTADQGSLLTDLKRYGYPAFGVYIFRSQRLFLVIRCGDVGRNGQGGHSHNDQLCAELQIDAADWVRDPGTYVYTALPERRNQYRSVKAHFAPQSGDCEPAPLDRGLFALPDQTKATAISFGPKEFVGMHYGYGKPTYRFVFLNETGVTIVDYLPREVAGDQDNTTILVRNPVNTQIPFSPGYGILASK